MGPKEGGRVVRFLIADDHAVVRMGVKALLAQQENWRVCAEAENGQEAVSKAQEHQPDLAILDVSMPVMSGFEAAVKIRQVSPATKILFLTMHDLATMPHVFKSAGVDACLSKDADSDVVIKTIAGLLDGKAKANGAGTVGQNPQSKPNQAPPASDIGK